MNQKEDKQTAVIIGSGPAGLTAAYMLLQNSNIKPIILEKEHYVGGISRTVEYNGNRIDIGGHRFFTRNQQVQELWNKLMPVQGKPSMDDIILKNHKQLNEEGPDPETCDKVFLIRRRISRILYLRKFFDYPITISIKTLKNLGFINTAKAGTGYMWSAVFKRKEITLEDFFINRFGIILYNMFFKDYTEKVWGRKPDKISADWGAQRIKGLSLCKAVFAFVSKTLGFGNSNGKVETSLIEQFMYPKKGPGQYWETMAEKIIEGGGEIIFDCKADRISVQGSKTTSVVCSSKGEKLELKADYIFSSMPVSDLIKAIDSNIPKDVYDTAVALPYRDFITVGLLVNKLKIQNTTNIKTISNIVPDCWIYIQEPDVKIGRLQIFNNWSPYMVKDIENTVWLGLEYFCDEGDGMWNMSENEFIDFAIDEAEKIGIINRCDVMDKIRIKVEKAYPAYFGTYKDFDMVKNYLNSIKNLYCIGRNGQHRYNNMDHSMLTAIMAVSSILCNGDKEEIWKVNTEIDYHE